jgi:hypothetical protein
MKRLAVFVGVFAVAGVLASCADAPPPADLIAVPTSPPTGFQIGPQVCNAALLEGELVADDEFGFAVTDVERFTTAVTWPNGYVARDAERRELLDGSGEVIAREGDHVALGGGQSAVGPGFVVCGDFDVTPVEG